MTREELAAFGHARHGMNWQSPLAREVGVTPRQMRRYASGESPIPDWLPIKLAAVTGATNTHLTTDTWIVGTDIDGKRQYVMRTVHPRFVARVVELDPETDEVGAIDADVRPESVVYRADLGLALAELHWIDPAPSGHDLTRTLEAACDAFERWELAQAIDDADDVEDTPPS